MRNVTCASPKQARESEIVVSIFHRACWSNAWAVRLSSCVWRSHCAFSVALVSLLVGHCPVADHKAEIGSLQGQAPVERTDCPPNKRTSRCHVQYQDPEQVKKRESPYWLHTPSQKDVVEAKKVRGAVCKARPTLLVHVASSAR